MIKIGGMPRLQTWEVQNEKDSSLLDGSSGLFLVGGGCERHVPSVAKDGAGLLDLP